MPKPTPHFKLLIARIFLIMTLFVFICPAVFGQDIVTIDILTVNDFHGTLLEEGKSPGAAKLAGFLKTQKQLNPDGTLILSAGDMFQGRIESNMLLGQSVLEVMNEIGFDAMAVGNHEFDWGIDVLNNLSSKAKFPFLSANVISSNLLKPVAFAEPYTLIEKKGVKIGIIGLTTLESKFKVKPVNISDIIFTDPAEAVNISISALRKDGAQIIIVLGHIGSEMGGQSSNIEGEAADLAGKVQGVDAIVSAHTHLNTAGKVNGIPIVQAGCWGQAVGKISLLYSKKDEKVIESKSDVIPAQEFNSFPDTKVKNIVEENVQKIAAIKNQMLGVTIGELSHQRTEFSLLGQWVTDIMRNKVKADIAFQNGGGLRASIPRGDITLGTIYGVVPFDNNLVTLDMTGEQIMKVLEHGIYNKKVGMLQYSGLKIIYDGSFSGGGGIVSVTTLDGKKLDLNKTYKVVTIDFLIEGGDGFSMFKEGKNLVDTHLLERDILIDFVKSVKKVNFKSDERFSLQRKAA